MLTPAYNLTATERILPSLTLDFTGAALDPRVTFTRSANTATVTNADGSISLVNADIPRFPYVSGVCQGLLIEETRTNIFLNSILNGAVTGTPGTSPTSYTNITTTGSISAIVASDYAAGYALEISCVVQRRTMRQRINVSAGTTYCFSITIDVVSSPFALNQYVIFQNIPAGTTFTYFRNGAPATAATVLSAGKNYIEVRAVAGSTSILDFVFGVGGQSNLTGVARFSNLQAEVGAFATSYIPTTTATVQRNADVAVMTGANFSGWWVPTNGGVVVRGNQLSVAGTSPWLQFDDTTADNIIALRGNTTNPELYIKATTDQATIDAGTIAARTNYGFAGAWNTNDCAAAINGGATVTDTSATIPTVTQARLGSDGTNYLNGHIQSIRYWPQRITDAETRAFSKL